MNNTVIWLIVALACALLAIGAFCVATGLGVGQIIKLLWGLATVPSDANSTAAVRWRGRRLN